MHDAIGSNIRIDTRGEAVLRILPRLNEEVNEEWLGDKSRYACDGLRTQRLDRPYIRKGGSLVEVSWDEALGDIARRLLAIREQHGGQAFAFYGGGGQGSVHSSVSAYSFQ